jgi:Helicase associated domain
MFDWLWKRLGGGGGISSETTAAADDSKTNDNNNAKKEEGAGTTAENKNDGVAGAFKEIKAIKVKPTIAKVQSSSSTTSAGSALTAVRTGNTRPIAGSSNKNTTAPSSKQAATIKKKDGTMTVMRGRPAKLTFDNMYERLVSYKAQHGHCCVPSTYKDDPALASFVRKTRRHYKAIKEWEATSGETLSTKTTTPLETVTSVPLTLYQIQQLEKIDFVWEGKRGRPVLNKE